MGKRKAKIEESDDENEFEGSDKSEENSDDSSERETDEDTSFNDKSGKKRKLIRTKSGNVAWFIAMM